MTVSYTINNPSPTVYNALLTFLRVVPQFEWLLVTFKINERKGWETIRSSSVELRNKDEIERTLETKATETKATETKATETKATETKATETKATEQNLR